MRKRDAGILPLLAALLLLLFCAAADAAGLTVMVYLSGGNLESERGAATADLREMMDALPDDGSLEVIVLASGAKAWACGVDPERSGIYRLTPAGLETLDSAPLASMGSAESLSRLLAYAHGAFPAERYALILWDHGAGPMGGLCFDELYEQGDSFDRLTLEELGGALENSPFREKKLAWVGLDACLMASAETAAALAPYAEYLIASEETEPAFGWDYAFLREAAADADGAQTGRRAAEAYARAYQGALDDLTLSVIDLSRVPALLERFSTLARGIEVTRENYGVYAAARLELRQMGGVDAGYFDLVDLRGLLLAWRELGAAGCDEALALLEAAIPFHYENARGCGGLSVYYPFENKARYASPWSLTARRLAFADGYVDFLDRACAYWLGEPLADWSRPLNAEVAEEETQSLYVMLTPEQCGQFASARLLVMKELSPGHYDNVYQSDDVRLLPGGLLRAAYGGEAMFLVDAEGLPVSDSHLFWEENGVLCTLAMLVYPDEEEILGERWETAWLVYKKNEAGDYEFVFARKDAPKELSGKGDYPLDGCREIWLVSAAREPAYSEDGRLLPLKEWIFTDEVYYTVLEGNDPFRPVVLPQQDGYRRYAFIEVTDLQGNTYCSGLTPLPERYRTELLRGVLLEENAEAAVILTEASAVYGLSPYLSLCFSVESRRTEGTLYASCQPLLDMPETAAGDPGGYYAWGFASIDPGETGRWELRFPAEFFEKNGVTELSGLTLSMLFRPQDDVLDQTERTVVIPLDFDPAILAASPGD